jgi:hypothetical protein
MKSGPRCKRSLLDRQARDPRALRCTPISHFTGAADMNTTNTANTPQRSARSGTAAPQAANDLPRSTSGRENSGLMFFFIGAAVLALMLVLFFNFLGPEGASRTGVADGPATAPAGQTTGGPSPANTTAQPGTGNSSAATGGDAPATVTAPQRPDSQTPPGREAVGAPVGNVSGTGQSPAQATPAGTSGTNGAAPAR